MVLGKKRRLFSIGNGAKIRPLEMGRKSPALTNSLDPDEMPTEFDKISS